MWNMNDVTAATERYADIRRTADKHNAMARMKAAAQDQTPDGKNKENKPSKLWARMRKALR